MDKKKLTFMIDLSHHNQKLINENKFPYTNTFCYKVTEGKTFRDSEAKNNILGKLTETTSEFDIAAGCYIGLYHYARPENNKVLEEFENFKKYCDEIIKAADEVCTHVQFFFVLDWEGNAVTWKNANARAAWINDFSRLVKAQYDKDMLLYCSASVANTLVTIKPDIPFWVAHYNIKEPRLIKDIKKRTIAWQFTSKPFDISIVDIERLKEL